MVVWLHVAGVTVVGLAGRVGEGVPDGGAAAVFVDGAFYLVGGSGGAPEESLREAALGRNWGSSLGCGIDGEVRERCRSQGRGSKKTSEGARGENRFFTGVFPFFN